MFVIAQHKITDPAGFWEAVKQAEMAADTKVLQVMPNAEGSAAVCLWESDSVNKVKQLVERTVGKFSSNTYYEVSEQTAVGLPVASR